MAETRVKIKGNGPPTENTPGSVGQIYIDVNTALRWECVEAHHETRYKGTREFYDWRCRGLDPEFLATDYEVPTPDAVVALVNTVIHVTESSDGTLTSDMPYEDITNALAAGNCVTCMVSTKARETATYAFAHAGYGYVAFGDAAEVVDDDGDDVPDGIFTHGGVVIYADDHVELREERGVVFSQFATVDAVQNAQTTAETAQTTAETAQTTAETAQTTAETAQTTADDLNARRLAATGGMVWTQSNITSGGNVKIVYADGLWVLSGLDGAEVDSIRSGLWYSEDGKTWVQSNVTIGGYRYATYADGLWVTGRRDGAGGGLLYSEDGKTWVKSNVTRGCAYADALYEDGLWVAACDRRLWYSEDGKTWVQSNAAYSFSRLIYGDGLWGASSNSGGGLWFSEDGKTWEATGSPFESGISTPIAYGGGLWIASESDSTHADTGEGLWYSEDGKAWTQSNETSSFGWSAAYVNGLWFAKYAGIVQYSEDGKTWVNCSADDIPIYADGMWVSGGDGLRYSEDGKTWTQSNLPTAQYNDFVPAYGGGLWVASGYIADGKVVGLWYSEDGKTWVQIHNSGASYEYSTPIYGDGVWVTASGSYGGNGLWYSSDLYAHKEYVDDRLAGLTTLPSPHALTLTGAVEATYDGSEDVTVEVPQAAASVKLNVLETLCENVALTDDSPSYVFDTTITLDANGLYLLIYTFEGDPSNDICSLAFVRDDVVRWGTAQADNSVTMSSIEVTDSWRTSGVTATLSIYKVEKVVTDPGLHSAMSLEGYNTVAPGSDAHAEGRETIAAGMYSHAEGTGSEALGDHTHAEGFNTIANGEYQHTQGKYNVVDEKDEFAHIVGNGTSESARSNAHTLDWDGNAWFAGDVYVGGSDKESGKKLTSVAEPDWNAAEGEDGYIKNRPFYEENGMVPLFESSTLSFSGSRGTYTATFDEPLSLVDGEEYYITLGKDDGSSLKSPAIVCASQTLEWSVSDGDNVTYVYVYSSDAPNKHGTLGSIMCLCNSACDVNYIKIETVGIITHRIDKKWLGAVTTAVLVTLSSSGWDSTTLTQSVTVSGILANESKQLIVPAPTMASTVAYNEAGILLTGQAENSVTFTTTIVPADDLRVYVTYQSVEVVS